MWGNIAIAFVLALTVTYVLTPYTIKLAKKIGAVDVPKDTRRMHSVEMPKFGGPAVIVRFFGIYNLFISYSGNGRTINFI